MLQMDSCITGRTLLLVHEKPASVLSVREKKSPGEMANSLN
jgi:hypothetical protein